MRKLILTVFLFNLIFAEPRYSYDFSTNIIYAWGFGAQITTYAPIKYIGFGIYYNKSFRTDYKAISIIINQGFNLPFYKKFSLELANLTGISYLFLPNQITQHIETNIGFTYDLNKKLRLAFYLITMIDPYNNKKDFNNCFTIRIKFIKFF